ncbi:MAG: threonine ammonia-lyase [Flavobacteriales bacterium]|nr:threonine ammonia-lyase [Flavobacteriales bacterium]
MIKLKNIQQAQLTLKDVVKHTSLEYNQNLSDLYECNVWLKREDLQVVRSYKLRGAYNKIATLSASELKNGVVCASAGNHAQGVAYACQKLGIKGTVFMPTPTPKLKIRQVHLFGKEQTETVLVGDTFDDCCVAAHKYSKENQVTFIHPFDDDKIIEGQGTVGLEILDDAEVQVDYVFVPVGGGGLAAGVGTVFKELSPNTKLIGAEPEGAPSMSTSLKNGVNTTLYNIEKFIDGASVKRIGERNFKVCKSLLNDMLTIPEGKVCTTMLKLYDYEAIVVEPAGALSIAALSLYRDQIKGKNVVCVVSGSNNDITRMEEIKERSLLHEGLKHYFIIRFPQRAGALKEFVADILGPNDDITHFEYTKKNSRAKGSAVVGIELLDKNDFEPLLDRIEETGFYGEYLNEKPDLFEHLI